MNVSLNNPQISHSDRVPGQQRRRLLRLSHPGRDGDVLQLVVGGLQRGHVHATGGERQRERRRQCHGDVVGALRDGLVHDRPRDHDTVALDDRRLRALVDGQCEWRLRRDRRPGAGPLGSWDARAGRSCWRWDLCLAALGQATVTWGYKYGWQRADRKRMWERVIIHVVRCVWLNIIGASRA